LHLSENFVKRFQTPCKRFSKVDANAHHPIGLLNEVDDLRTGANGGNREKKKRE
jgi:hypothetical protein